MQSSIIYDYYFLCFFWTNYSGVEKQATNFDFTRIFGLFGTCHRQKSKVKMQMLPTKLADSWKIFPGYKGSWG